jgi:hypothetical protein
LKRKFSRKLGRKFSPKFFVFAKISAKISFIFRDMFCFRKNLRENFVHFSRNFLRKQKINEIFAKSFAKIAYIFRENFLENEKRRFLRKFTFQPYSNLLLPADLPHHFGGAGAATRCGFGSDGSGSKPDVKHG